MKPFGLAMLGLGLLVAAGANAQRGPSLPNDLPAVDAAAMLKTVAPDLEKRIARFKPVRMPFDAAGLNANERQMIDQLVIASRALESMYWRQSDPEALALYNALEGDKTPLAQKLLGVRLQEKGFKRERDRHRRYWSGLGLAADSFDDDPVPF